MAKRAQPMKRHYRCTRCKSLVPAKYKVCGVCGFDPAHAASLFDKALAMFPGSHEIHP